MYANATLNWILLAFGGGGLLKFFGGGVVCFFYLGFGVFLCVSGCLGGYFVGFLGYFRGNFYSF